MQDKLRAYYLPLLQRHGPTAQGVGWSGEETQQRRYMVLECVQLNIWRPDATVLDVGCGWGALLTNSCGSPFRYLGIDAIPEMIELARELWPLHRFEVGDIRTGNYSADYVLASGIFALSDWDELCEVVAAMWKACRIAVAFNFLTDGDGLGPETHFNPYVVLHECRHHAPWCTLRMDYHARDATVYMYREAMA